MKAVLVLLALGLAIAAHAKPAHSGSAVPPHCVLTNAGREICPGPEKRTTRHARVRTGHLGRDPRPRAWCGWWMRHHLGVADRRYNRAAAWAHYGSPAHGPHVGAIVVWRHHVGILTAKTPRGWRVKSGNDGHRVRDRVRSLKGAIAFRLPPQRWAGL